MSDLLNYLLTLDTHLITLVSHYGNWTYLALFIIIFCETGLIITPFLPGDSLLFIAGTIAAYPSHVLHVGTLFFLLLLASFLGNQVNYSLGRLLGSRVFNDHNFRLINKNQLKKAHDFYQKNGGKALIIARFMPIVRTFIPFVAGVCGMSWRNFTYYNALSAVLWVGSLVIGGYFFGNLPIIKNNFALFVYAIIFVSLLYPVLGMIRHKLKNWQPAALKR